MVLKTTLNFCYSLSEVCLFMRTALSEKWSANWLKMKRRLCRMKELLIFFLSLLIGGTVLILHHDSFIQLNADYSTSHHDENGHFVCSCNRETIDISKVCHFLYYRKSSIRSRPLIQVYSTGTSLGFTQDGCKMRLTDTP